jgi:hypothetical protein
MTDCPRKDEEEEWARDVRELRALAANRDKALEQGGRDVRELLAWIAANRDFVIDTLVASAAEVYDCRPEIEERVALFEREYGLLMALADVVETTRCAKTNMKLYKIFLQLQELGLARSEFAGTPRRYHTRRATAGKVMGPKRLRDRLRPHVFKALDQHPMRKWTIAQVLQRIPAEAYESESASLSTLRRRVDELMKEHASAQARADQGS